MRRSATSIFAYKFASASTARQYYPAAPDSLPIAVGLCERINPDAVQMSSAFFGLESWS